MTPEFRRFVAEVKAATKIEDIISETHPLIQKGAWWKARGDASLQVNPSSQIYIQFGDGDEGQGDVFRWLYKTRNMEFYDALKHCAERLGMDMPRMNDEEKARAQLTTQRLTIISAITDFWMAELWRSEKALAYCRGRGWTDDTIRYRTEKPDDKGNIEIIYGAGLGYTGDDWATRLALRTHLEAQGFDLDAPAVVAALGYKGSVPAYFEKWQAHLFSDRIPPKWIEENKIGGAMKGMLVYVYREHGQATYWTHRAIDKAVDKKRAHLNPHAELIGDRPPYFAFSYSRSSDAVVSVEGEADAISLAQADINVIAEGMLSARDTVVRALKRHKVIYIAKDNARLDPKYQPEDDADEDRKKQLDAEREKAYQATMKAAREEAAEIGPLTRIVTELPFKDCNAWLTQGTLTRETWLVTIKAAPTLAEELCRIAGEFKGKDKDAYDEALRHAVECVALLDKQRIDTRGDALAQLAGMKPREFKRLIKDCQGEAAERAEGKDDEAELESDEIPTIETRGQCMIAEHVIDLVWDKNYFRFLLAVRYPNGDIALVKEIELDGVRYIPTSNSDLMALGYTVIFANGLNETRKPLEVTALQKRIVEFANKYFDAPAEFVGPAAWWIIQTWLFDCFNTVSYLRLLGPFGVGKSRFADTFGFIAYRAVRAAGGTSLASFFRTLHEVRGTLVVDEVIPKNGTLNPEVESYFNLGTSRFSPYLLRTEQGAAKEFAIKGFNPFGPKIFGAIKTFEDEATNSRCITHETQLETTRKMPIELNRVFLGEAEEIRKELMTFRMAHWETEKAIDYDAVDETLSKRSKQVGAALFTIVTDPETRAQITRMLLKGENRHQSKLEMSLEAKAIRALVTVLHDAPKGHGNASQPYWDLRLSHLLNLIQGWVFDDEDAPPALKSIRNEAGDIVEVKDNDSPRNNDKHWVKKWGVKKLGNLYRTLDFSTAATTWGNKSFGVVHDPETFVKLPALCRKYAVEWLAPHASFSLLQADAAPQTLSLSAVSVPEFNPDDEYLQPVED